MRVLRLPRWGACLSLTLALSACSGGGTAPSTFSANATTPSLPVVGNAAVVAPATFEFTIPRSAAHAASALHAAARKLTPQYVPASTLSLKVALVTVDGIAPSPTPTPTITDVTGCTITAANYTCTVTLGLPVGTDVVNVMSYDGAGASGNLLSQQNGTFTVVAATANNFSMTLDAKPGTIVVSGPGCSGSPVTCSESGSGAVSLTLTVADAHGTALANNAIPGSPVLTVVSSNTSIATVTATQAPYGISLTPVAIGTATIAVTAHPASGTSGLPNTTLSFTVMVTQQLNGPAGVAVDSAGNIYVVSRSSQKLKIFDNTGAVSTIAGGAITTSLGPWGTAVDTAGNIYVTSTSSNNVQIFTNTGVASTIAGGTITGLSSPYGVAVDAAGNIYVANFGAHNVKIFTSSGAPSSIAGGTITTGLTSPCGVALDSVGNIYVSDCGTYSIKIFTNSTTSGGVPSTTIGVGSTGTIPSSAGLSNPIAIAVDSSGTIYAANFGNNSTTVNAFTSAGVLSHAYTVGVNPAGVAVASGNLYVSSLTSSTVTVYNASTGAVLNTIH